MKTLALCLAFTAALAAPAAFAKPAPARAPARSTLSRTAAAEAPPGKDGQNTSLYCSSQNPNIEYRDCVNAATRDPNAKVRMG